jgi:hypothetical protein
MSTSHSTLQAHQPSIDESNLTELRAGQPERSYKLPTSLLAKHSPYLHGYLVGRSNSSNTSSSHSPSDHIKHHRKSPAPSTNLLHLPSELDHEAMDLFHRWVYGHRLAGPTSFHGLQHYLGLYTIAHRLDMESLQNTALDLIRGYYRTHQMSAPAHRLEYVYKMTEGPNALRRFLVHSAAFRMLAEMGLGAFGVPPPLRGVLVTGGEIAVDLVEALVKQHWDGVKDVREGDDCEWHEHRVTKACQKKDGK